MMKKIMIITMPIILAVSVIMVLNSANVNVFGQANQTSTNNQTISQAANQTSTGGNHTSDVQLLNYTTNAIQAQKDKKGSVLTDNLQKLQDALLQKTGQQKIIVPETSSKDSKSSGSSSSDSKSSGSSSSGSSSSGSSSSDSKSKK